MISGRSVGHPVGKTITWCTFTLPRGKLAGYVHGEHSGKEDIARQRQLGWNLPNRIRPLSVLESRVMGPLASWKWES
jgi:hypothetical protein